MDQLDKLKQQELHIFHSLVGKVAEKDAQLNSMSDKINQLQTDLIYNLQLIEHRDADLEKLEFIHKASLAKSTDLVAHNIELKAELSQKNADLKAVQSLYDTSLLEHRESSRLLKREFTTTMSEKENEFAMGISQLQAEISQLSSKLSLADQDLQTLTNQHMTQINKLNHMHSIDLSKLQQNHSNMIKELEHKLKLANAEKNSANLEIAQLQSQATLHLEANAKTEAELSQVRWEFANSNRMAAEHISHLETAIKQGDYQAEKQSREFSERIVQLKQEFISKEKILTQDNQMLRDTISSLQKELLQSKKLHGTQFNEQKHENEQLKNDLIVLNQKLDLAAKQNEEKDLEIGQLIQANQEKLESTSSSLRLKIEKLEIDIAEKLAQLDAIDAEKASMGDYKIQMERVNADWQNKLEQLSKEKIQEAEHIISSLEKEIRHLKLDKMNHGSDLDPSIMELEAENLELRRLVSEMRQEMENTRTEIANQKPQNDTETHHLERLLNDKQRLIDQLLDSQAMFHSTINNMRSENPIDHDADFREQNMELQDLILENEQLTDLSNSLAARLRQNTKDGNIAIGKDNGQSNKSQTKAGKNTRFKTKNPQL